MTDYKLTPEQRKYLDSLVCQRVTDDKANKEIIKNFKNIFKFNVIHFSAAFLIYKL